MLRIDEQILNIDKAICRHIEQLETLDRGAASQDILKNLRDFVEHIMLKIHAGCADAGNDWESIQNAVKYVKSKSRWKELTRFHELLQISVSHYTNDEENSERLMLKYYMYLLKIKKTLHQNFNLDVLHNIEKFPLQKDAELQEYYGKISTQVDHACQFRGDLTSDKYHIQKIKPFFVDGKIYYEVTFSPANDYASKFDRSIAFTNLDITDFYAVKFSFIDTNIENFDNVMPIRIITNWEVSIRDCEYSNFTALVRGAKLKTSYSEQRGIARFLTSTGFSLVELAEFSDVEFFKVKAEVTKKSKPPIFFQDLEHCRRIIRSNAPGGNLLRYLLYHMNNKMIKAQHDSRENAKLSGLFVQYGCIPFDAIPYNFYPRECKTRLYDLFACIPPSGREHELLARFVKNNTEIGGKLFTPTSEIKERFGIDIATLIAKYESTLYEKHREAAKLSIDRDHIFINKYRDDVLSIISQLKSLSQSGILNYSAAMKSWLKQPNIGVDCEQKKDVLTKLFDNSRVALIYGAAGTGKSTLINHIAQFFDKKKKLFLAHTNPAVENLKRRVTASECTFSTTTKFLHPKNVIQNVDMVVIDECSTVSNNDMRKILSKLLQSLNSSSGESLLLVLVGDTYQIDSIEFGNWFDIARKFVPDASVCELTRPWRSNDNGLLKLWERVREMDGTKPDAVLESLTRQGYTEKLNKSIFSASENDEIVLCLNYDGLYGINNINRFLQENNPHNSVFWGIHQYKIGDPVLFNDSDRFSPVIHNNTKGKIADVQILNKGQPTECVQFDIELDRILMGTDAFGQGFELLQNASSGNSVIRFSAAKSKNADDDGDERYSSKEDVVPFQVAYAVSIHKSQGLEYDSVKIVITDEIDELITHNVFYTAITRTKNRLKIYWTPEVEKKVLESIQPKRIGRDVALLRNSL